MSARNYSNCPKCFLMVRDVRAERFKKASTSYGHVTQLEFEELIRIATETKDRDGTLAEYYEWEFTSLGKWWMRYSCSCDVCGFTFEHKTQADFKV